MILQEGIIFKQNHCDILLLNFLPFLSSHKNKIAYKEMNVLSTQGKFQPEAKLFRIK